MEKEKYEIINDKKWLKIFYHDMSKGETFSDYDDVINSSTERKYSILYKIGDTYRNKSNGYFEFLLRYPGKEGFNNWKQIINPLDSNENFSSETLVFLPINLTWPESFGGIQKSRDSRTVFDCCNRSQLWWYAIGITNYSRTTFPAYPSIELSKVELFIRVQDPIKCISSCNIGNQLIFVRFFLFTFTILK